jgi:hypothetical protein
MKKKLLCPMKQKLVSPGKLQLFKPMKSLQDSRLGTFFRQGQDSSLGTLLGPLIILNDRQGKDSRLGTLFGQLMILH